MQRVQSDEQEEQGHGPEHEGVCVGLRPAWEVSRPGLQRRASWGGAGVGCLHHRALGQDTALVMRVLFSKISISVLFSLMICVIGSPGKTFMQNRESSQKNTQKNHSKSHHCEQPLVRPR